MLVSLFMHIYFFASENFVTCRSNSLVYVDNTLQCTVHGRVFCICCCECGSVCVAVCGGSSVIREARGHPSHTMSVGDKEPEEQQSCYGAGTSTQQPADHTDVHSGWWETSVPSWAKNRGWISLQKDLHKLVSDEPQGFWNFMRTDCLKSINNNVVLMIFLPY